MGAAMDETYGALLIGVFFAIFLQGILTLQAYIYFETFPNDRLRLKALVAVVWVLDTMHLVLICQVAYHYLVTKWGVEEALHETTWPFDVHLIFVGASAILCQAFFINRIWIFSKKNVWLAALLAAACLTTFAVDVTMGVQNTIHPRTSFLGTLTTEIVVLFALGAAVDLTIALVLVYYLQKGMRDTFSAPMQSVFSTVIQFTVATGLATSFLAIACLVTYLVSRHSFIYIALHFSLGRLYTNALLATLNSRQSIRSKLNQTINRAIPTPSAVLSLPVTAPKTPGDSYRTSRRQDTTGTALSTIVFTPEPFDPGDSLGAGVGAAPGR